jgi:hypothetical protein
MAAALPWPSARRPCRWARDFWLASPLYYKGLITRSRAEDTALTELFNIGWNAPHRALRNRAGSEWEDAVVPHPVSVRVRMPS